MNSHDSHRLVVYFALSKGEGELPCLADLTQSEESDLRLICKFYLHIDKFGDSAPGPDVINDCVIYYDGVSPVPGFSPNEESYGLRVEEDRIVGRVRPVICFNLFKPVAIEDFRKLVWCSWYKIGPARGCKEFYAEDWNGYTEVLSPYRASEWKLHLQRNRAYSGKRFSVAQLTAGVCAHEL